jgi:hypothetical protein
MGEGLLVGAELGPLIARELKRLGITWTAQDYAPGSFEDLARHCSVQSLIVWAGASDGTIYGDPRVNWMFRAWHDACHIILNAPFTLDGERYVAKYQAGCLGDLAGRIVIAEVAGQAEHYALTGSFPINQVKFVTDYLKHMR